MPEYNQQHLEPDAIAAFAEHRLSGDTLISVERHLAECATCRREVAQVVRVLRRPARPWRGAGVLAAAAVLVIAIVQLRSPESGSPRVRSDAASDRIDIVAPDSLLAPNTPIRFTWRALEPSTRYELSLADEAGSRMFSVGSADTVVTLPDSVSLQPGRTYQWFVDALRPDGRSTTSGVRFLRIVP